MKIRLPGREKAFLRLLENHDNMQYQATKEGLKEKKGIAEFSEVRNH